MSQISSPQLQKQPCRLAGFVALIAALLSNAAPAFAEADLPLLGDLSSTIVSIEQERKLGNQMMLNLRRASQRTWDPQIQNFTELLLFKLAKFSQLQDKDLRLTLIKDPSINAFAAPGSVVGINLGLFLAAETESEFTAVLAHEIAHLSQRHYARSKENQQKQTLPYLAGLLGSILLLSTGSAEAGLAALRSTQAGAIANKLRYNRNLEREADRIGIALMHEAGFDPQGMASIFNHMHQLTRHNSRPPEFLLTHPVSESRIADARAQSARFVPSDYPPSLNYQIIRARAEAIYIEPENMIDTYRKKLDSAPDQIIRSASLYGLVLAFMKAEDFKQAQRYMDVLMAGGAHLPHQLLQLELWIESDQARRALPQLQELLAIYTDNLSIAWLYKDALIKAFYFKEAQQVVKRQTQLHPNNIDLWYSLAEISGQAKDIMGVHKARAEFYALRGDWESAIGQLESALKLANEDSSVHQSLAHRLEQIREIRKSG